MCLIPEVGQAYVSGIVTEADPAIMPDAVLTTLDDETVQVLVGPAQHSLASGVEIGDGTVAANEQAAPDQRADAAQDDAQLVHHRFGVRGRLRHCAIMASAAVSPVAPSPSSDHQRIRDGAWQFAQLACDDIGQPGNAHAWLSPGWAAALIRAPWDSGLEPACCIARVADRSESCHFEIEVLVRTAGHGEVGAEPTRSIRLQMSARSDDRRGSGVQ